MVKCKYCQSSNLFLRTNSHGLCKKCQAAIREKAGAERDQIKGHLISARFLKDPSRKVHHLERALDGTKKLLRYEKMGCPQPAPSPGALKAFLDEKLLEASVAQQLAEEATTHPQSVPRTSPDDLVEAVGLSLLAGMSDGLGSGNPQGHEGVDVRLAGTRRVRRHSAKFGVWMDRTTFALTQDISSRGLCVRSDALIRPGTRVGMTLEAPDRQVAGDGMVRWAHRRDTAEDGSSQAIMGVEFLAPPPDLPQES